MKNKPPILESGLCYLGDGYTVYDIDHYKPKFWSEGAFDIGFTKKNQKNFFNAINECNDEKIKKYLNQTINKTYDGGKPTRGGSLVKFDINGTCFGERAIIKLANKFESLSEENKKKAITILESLLLAHKTVEGKKNLGHKKIIKQDIHDALDISEKHVDCSFKINLRRILETDYSVELINYDVTKLRKQGSESGNVPAVFEDITTWLDEEEFKIYELKEQENLTKEQENLTKEQKNLAKEQENLAKEQENLAKEKEKTTKAAKSDNRRTTDLKPQTSPTKTSASPSAGGSRAPQH